MDSGTLITVIVAIGAIQLTALFAIAAFIWQIRSQRGQLESRIEELDVKLSSEIREQVGELRDELREQGNKVTEATLDQARLDGVNSVLLYQSHTHEPYPQQPHAPEAAD